MNVEINERLAKKLIAMAKEEGKSAKSFLYKLIREEDRRRHVIWSAPKEAHVRTKCPRPLCQVAKRVVQHRDAD